MASLGEELTHNNTDAINTDDDNDNNTIRTPTFCLPYEKMYIYCLSHTIKTIWLITYKEHLHKWIEDGLCQWEYQRGNYIKITD